MTAIIIFTNVFNKSNSSVMKKILAFAAVAACLVSFASCSDKEETKDPIDDVVLENGKISYTVNFEAPEGYATVVEQVSTVQNVVEMGMMDDAKAVLGQALYNAKDDIRTSAAVSKTKTDAFFYGVMGNEDISAGETYYIAAVALTKDENGDYDFSNDDIVMITYPASAE